MWVGLGGEWGGGPAWKGARGRGGRRPDRLAWQVAGAGMAAPARPARPSLACMHAWAGAGGRHAGGCGRGRPPRSAEGRAGCATGLAWVCREKSGSRSR